MRVSRKDIHLPVEKHNLVVLFKFCIICSIYIIYFYFSMIITRNAFKPTANNYYIYLLDAFFHGRVNITPPMHTDLSLFQNKWYMYWGPAPIFFILPFYFFSHLYASDVLYTAIGGIMNVVLFYFVVQEFRKYFSISLSLMSEVFLLLSFGLASPNFFLSTHGQIWYTSQIFATTYLLLSYLFYFKFLNSDRHYHLILCTVFFYLAFLSRYTLLFHGVLFIYLLMHYKSSSRAIPTKIIWSFALLTLAFGSLGALYNYLKFHNILETGQRFQASATARRYAAILKHDQTLSFHYVFHNIYYYFLNVISFSPTRYPVIINAEGNSIFSVYPALLLLPVLFYNRKYLDRKRLSFLRVAGMIITLTVSFLMLYFATGWLQFGNRYIFDVIPLLFLLLTFILQYIPLSIQVGLLLYGILLNVYGILGFFRIPVLFVLHITIRVMDMQIRF